MTLTQPSNTLYAPRNLGRRDLARSVPAAETSEFKYVGFDDYPYLAVKIDHFCTPCFMVLDIVDGAVTEGPIYTYVSANWDQIRDGQDVTEAVEGVAR